MSRTSGRDSEIFAQSVTREGCLAVVRGGRGGPVAYALVTGGSGSLKRGAYGEREARTYNGGFGALPVGSRGKAQLVRGSGGEAP